MRGQIYYIDIDGTMTDAPMRIWGNPDITMILLVQELCIDNIVVIWSAGGWEYAKAFCKKYDINPTAILPKPDIMIDDCLTIRHGNHIKLISPEEFKKENI